MQIRRLALVRHAEAATSAPSDADRRLTPRGRRDAAGAGRWLAAAGFRPEVALVSTAARTRETWEEMRTAAGWSLQPTLEDGVYAGSAESVVDLVRTLDDAVGTLLVIGHNPTMATLAQMLDDGTGEAGATDALIRGFPTAAVACYDVSGAWGDLAWGGAAVVGFHVPADD